MSIVKAAKGKSLPSLQAVCAENVFEKLSRSRERCMSEYPRQHLLPTNLPKTFF